jgi:hypothetical protein
MAIALTRAFSCLPDTLRDELVNEFRLIQTSYYGRKWSPAELSGGRFCEIVYSIINGHVLGSYPSHASKPRNFLVSCQALEQKTTLPRSFRILIPRLLPALYEVRNNRGVGHVGGDVDPNFMDSSLVLATTGWIVSELIRVLHSLTLEEAQQIVSRLTSHKSPAVWVSSATRRVLVSNLTLKEKVLVLVGSNEEPTAFDDLVAWIEDSNKAYVKRIVNSMHKSRLLEFEKSGQIELLPPGVSKLQEILEKAEEI